MNNKLRNRWRFIAFHNVPQGARYEIQVTTIRKDSF